jgi:hypothetical protein
LGLDRSADKNLIDTIITSFGKNEETLDPSSFTMEDYLKLTESGNTNSITDPQLKNYIDNIISNYENYYSSLFNDPEVSDFFAGLTDEEKNILGSISIDKEATVDEVKKALVAGQTYADANAIISKIKIDVEDDILNNLYSGNIEEAKKNWLLK